MSRVRAVLVGCVVAFPLLAHGAELTKLATSFEDDDPFGMFVDFSLERTQTRSLLVRERVNEAGDAFEEVGELEYSLLDTRANLDLRIGIYQDLELRYRVPFVFQHNELWRYAESSVGADGENSTIRDNCINSRGEPLDPACATSGAGADPLWDLPVGAYRVAFGNMTFGLAYAFFNQKKDDTKPTWILGLEYEAPTAALLDPSMQTLPSNRGNIGDRNHKYKLFTAFSRKMGFVDPYFQVWYQLPFRGPGWYSNCSSPVDSMGYPENCGRDPWTRSETGIKLPHRAGIDFGSEFTFFEDAARKQRYVLDLRLHANYIGAGRYYNEMSGLNLKLNSSTDFLQVGGDVLVRLQMAEYVQLRAVGSLSYNTEHFVTAEELGADLDGNGSVDAQANPDEINPNFDFRTDVAGRRFRATQQTVFGLQVGAQFAF